MHRWWALGRQIWAIKRPRNADCYKSIIIDLLNEAYQGAAHKGFMTLNPSNGSS
jgi:hypothetical protein